MKRLQDPETNRNGINRLQTTAEKQGEGVPLKQTGHPSLPNLFSPLIPPENSRNGPQPTASYSRDGESLATPLGRAEN